MNNSKTQISDALTFYALFVSGAVFSGFLNYGSFTLCSFVFVLSFCVGIFLLFYFAQKLNCNFSQPKKHEFVFILPLLFCCGGLFFSYTSRFISCVPSLSEGFSQKWFAALPALISLFCAFTVSKKGLLSFCGISVICLTLVIVPLFITWFCFLGYVPYDGFSFKQNFDIKSDYIFRALSFSAEIPLLFTLFSSERKKSFSRGAFFGILLFLLTLFLESAKHIAFFGINGAGNILTPEKTMLSAIPFLNARELYVFAFYFSYMIKITLCFCAATVLMKRLFESFSKERFLKHTGVSVFSLFFIFFLVASRTPDLNYFYFESALCVLASATAVLGIFANYAFKIKKATSKNR